jgi:hypothetical protein
MVVQSLDAISRLRNGAAIIRRLRWLDGRLRWHAWIRRSDFVSLFGISPQQASADIATYQEVAAGNARLDPATRTYRREPEFTPLFPNDAFVWMARAAEDGDAAVIRCEQIALPSRQADDSIMKAVFEAYGSRLALLIDYQSMTSREPSERVICPHHVVDTGDRLHLRAWDDRRRIFTDFVVGRIRAARIEPNYPWVDEVADTEWQKTVDVVLGPQAGLSPSQRSAIEMEFGMKGGQVIVSTRKALLAYLLDRLGLLNAVRECGDAASAGYGTQCLNAAELKPFVTTWHGSAVGS